MKNWTVKSDINDTNAPHNVYEFFWLEGPNGEVLRPDEDHDPRPNGNDAVKEMLQEIANKLNND